MNDSAFSQLQKLTWFWSCITSWNVLFTLVAHSGFVLLNGGKDGAAPTAGTVAAADTDGKAGMDGKAGIAGKAGMADMPGSTGRAGAAMSPAPGSTMPGMEDSALREGRARTALTGSVPRYTS